MLPKTARQMVVARYADEFESAVAHREQPLPAPRANEVVIRNRFAGVNGVYDYRLAKGQITAPDPKASNEPPFCFGFEAVGEVAATGEGVTQLAPGDAVATVRFGHAYCDYHVIEASAAIPVPEISPEILTLIPTGTSALVALEQVGEISSGERVLVSAAAGGLGHIAVQIAKQRGNHVTALAGSAEKVARLTELGVDTVINYREVELHEALTAASPSGFNLIWIPSGAAFSIPCSLIWQTTVGWSSRALRPMPTIRSRLHNRASIRSCTGRPRRYGPS